MSDSDDTSLPPAVVAVCAKPAIPGESKTRLAESIGDDAAMDLYRAFLADTARRVDDFTLSGRDDVAGVLAHASAPNHDSFAPFETREFEMMPQGEGNLGARLARIVDRCFERGAERLILLGADSPTLLDRHLTEAFETLRGNDVTVGPSFDGGYYLLGLRGAATTLFENVDWSTDRVMGQTLRRAKSSALLCELIEFWYDVDTFEDLRRLHTHLLEYLARRHQRVAPETTRALRRLSEDGTLTDWDDSLDSSSM